MPNFIASGTVNVTAGQTVVTFEDVLLTEARDGDTLELYGANKGRYTLAAIGADLVSAQLSVPFDGVTQADAPYTVRYDSLQRVPPLELADQLRRMRDQIRIFERTAPLYRVQSLGANVPPGAPVTGDMYVVGAVPTGAWAGQAGNLAQWTGAVWQFTTAETGWMAYSVASGKVYFRGTSAWLPYVAPSAFIETLMDDANAAAARATLGGTAFQALGTLTGVAGSFARFTGAGAADAVMQAIVGTVSQSGGTPTGAIVERGSNANGEYVRFADGTQICWRATPGTTLSTTTAANGLYRTDPSPVSFPASFVGAPLGCMSIAPGNGWLGTLSGINATQWSYQLLALQAITAGATNGMMFYAIGRWF